MKDSVAILRYSCGLRLKNIKKLDCFFEDRGRLLALGSSDTLEARVDILPHSSGQVN